MAKMPTLTQEETVRLMHNIKESVNLVQQGHLYYLGNLNQEAWIGQQGAAILAVYDAQVEHIARLEVEVARLRESVAQWGRFNSTLIDTWDDDEDYDEEEVCDD